MLVFLCFGGGDFTAVVLIYSGDYFFGWTFCVFVVLFFLCCGIFVVVMAIFVKIILIL